MKVIVRRYQFQGCDDGIDVYRTENATEDLHRLYEQDVIAYNTTDEYYDIGYSSYELVNYEHRVLCEICEVEDIKKGN